MLADILMCAASFAAGALLYRRHIDAEIERAHLAVAQADDRAIARQRICEMALAQCDAHRKHASDARELLRRAESVIDAQRVTIAGLTKREMSA